MARKGTRKFWLIGIVLLLGAGGSVPAILANVGETGEARASVDWPTTAGTIQSAAVTAHHGKMGTYWEVTATYDYQAGGAPRHGNVIGYYDEANFDHEAGARALAARYPEGGHVDVHYDPEHPDRAVLIPGRKGMGFVAIALFGVMGLGFLAGAFACFRRALRGRVTA